MKARIHWNTQRRMWTIHTYKGCEWGHFLSIQGPWVVETKPSNRTNPRGFVVCDRKQINVFPLGHFNPDVLGRHRLIYNKEDVSFNFGYGRGAYFTPHGAYVIAGQLSPGV
jgi:hypothetical protein